MLSRCNILYNYFVTDMESWNFLEGTGDIAIEYIVVSWNDAALIAGWESKMGRFVSLFGRVCDRKVFELMYVSEVY